MLDKVRRGYVDPRVFTALAVLALFSVISTVVSIEAVQKLVTARQAGVVDSNARIGLMNLTSDLSAAESAQRGYLLTGDPTYLVPYTKIQQKLPADLAGLKQTVAGTKYVTAVNAVSPIVEAKMSELATTIAKAQGGDQAGAVALVNTGQGQAIMTSLTSTIASLTVQLTADVNASRTTINHYANLARGVGLLALAGTLILVVGVYFLFDHAIEAERALDRAKDEFVSLASHQLRTPATGIKSILSMLEQGDFGALTEKQVSVVAKAIASNDRELAIIEELLNVAKADAGRLVLKPAEVNLGELIDQIVGEQRPAIQAKSLKLKYDHPHSPVVLVADEEKLYMAISNLIDNARKYTPEDGQISVTVDNHRGQARIMVADNGIGIDEAEIAHIFDRFQRSQLVLMGTIEGTGLGLYLARRIAELHHGTINVDSKKGHGSRFIMVLPRRILQ